MANPVHPRRAWIASVLLAAALAAAVYAQEAPRHFLWKVTAGNGSQAYLLGSVHVLTPAFYPLDPAIDRAFQSSRVLVEEVDLDEMTNPATLMRLVGKAMLPDGQTLDQVVASDTYAAIRTRAEAHGVPLALLQRMKPWMAAVTLTTAALTRAGFDSGLGIDKHFFDRAKAAGLPRRALETVSYQFDRLDGLGAAMQEASLKVMLADIDAQAGNIETLAAAWKRGDAATLERLLREGFTDEPELAERLLYERNRNWVPQVERCLTEDERCFVVVGAAHLVGPHSLVALLRDRRLSVVQQ
ncbi:MAG TPA: TraB/GumN family protein [Vicinamibacterales bacterium]|nr:TraB/GumN family protein [Vicinamibacterales bacterium]